MVEGLPALLTVEEAGVLLRIGRTKAYAMAREWRDTGGRAGLPVVDFGNVLRVPRHALEEMIGTELGGREAAATVEKPTSPSPARPDPSVAEPVPPVPDVSAATNAAARPSTRRSRTGRAPSNQLNLFGSPPPAA